MIHKKSFSFYLDVIFEPKTFDDPKKTCGKFLARYGPATGRMTCKESCRSNNDCEFYFYGNDVICDLYSVCNTTRNTVKIGSTFKKKGEYNDKFSQSVYTQNILLFILSKVN